MQSRTQRFDLFLLRLALIIEGANCHQGIFHLLECHEDGLLVLGQYLPCLGLCCPLLEPQALRVEQRPGQSESAHAEFASGEQKLGQSRAGYPQETGD